MKKHATWFYASFIFLLGFTNADESTKKVQQAAQDNLEAAINKIPAGMETRFGFEDASEPKNCTAGKPYRMLALSKEFYDGIETTIKNSILEQNEWRVPVIAKGHHRTLLSVAGLLDNLKVVDLGGAQLAAELEQKTKMFTQATEFCILRIYPLECDFLVVKKSANWGDDIYVPLTSATIAINSMGDKAATGVSLTEMLQAVKAEIKLKTKN